MNDNQRPTSTDSPAPNMGPRPERILLAGAAVAIIVMLWAVWTMWTVFS